MPRETTGMYVQLPVEVAIRGRPPNSQEYHYWKYGDHVDTWDIIL